ncbi:MAG: phosphatase PAP2 family protein [Frankiaceae bacterium]|jgi:membrane-associated phospholipid phosphatase|nr:phosphatase PAP2 family protein [Frankiaceae bacterium]
MPAPLGARRPWWRSQFAADYLRPFAVAAWAAAFISAILIYGIPTAREQLIVWLALGAVSATVGVRNPLWVIVDWLPFAAFLIGYDYSRGAADSLGSPIRWTPQIEMDRLLFFGQVPTVWLQEHLRQGQAQWWEAGVALTYTSHFIVPYAMCAWYWLRNRLLFLQFAGRFIALSFVGIAGYILVPAAPPWAASRCTPAEVAGGHVVPRCIGRAAAPPGNLLGAFHPGYPGTAPYLQRVTLRGYELMHLKFAAGWLREGQAAVNYVAAVPSLHGAFSVLILIFCWRRVRWWWRPVLVGYPLAMMFTLVYSGEHYVTDVLLGWAAAAAVCVAAAAIERRLARPRSSGGVPRTADRQPDGETSCPQTAMTSSSA